MLEIFQYDFMRRAFLAGVLLAVIVPCIGTVVVLRRMSMIGDALSHTSLAGVAAGLLAGFNPVLGAVVVSVLAAVSIESIRKRIPEYSEMAIAIILSAGIGLAGVLSGFVKQSASFNSFLFGSIVAISDLEITLVAAAGVIVLLSFIILYKELFFISLDEQGARLAGVPVERINFIFTILTALTVSIAARTVGALIVSSLMVIPVACAMQLGGGYRKTLLYSVAFALFFVISGLFISYYLSLKPGGTIVLTGVITLAVIISIKRALPFGKTVR